MSDLAHNNSTPKESYPGMALNGISPYFTMFPLDFPLSILTEHARPGDEVIDPFCGRGTTNFASRLRGLKSYGIDSSPVAFAISEGKLACASVQSILAAYDSLLEEVGELDAVPDNEFWQMLYQPDVLKLICRLRKGLILDCGSQARKALRAIILGALHGPKAVRNYSYFSNQCPRTYAPKPRYAVNYWRSHGLEAPLVDVRQIIAARALRYYPDEQLPASGGIILGDSRDPQSFSAVHSQRERVTWVITSPPYYGMQTYIPDQWLRNWFVGGPESVDYSSSGQIAHTGPAVFADDLRRVWRNLLGICSENCRMVIRFGAINDRKANHIEIIRSSLNGSGWRISEIRPAGSAGAGHRQANHFLSAKKNAIEEIDIWAETTH